MSNFPQVFSIPSLVKMATLAILGLTPFAFAQESSQSPAQPCSTPEAAQFDFWVGEWDATWEGGGGENIITKEFDNCVIHERFRAYPDSTGSKPLVGLSVSAYVPAEKVWKQTWVDNSGSYLDFTGGFSEGKMTLTREFTSQKGKDIVQRMVWYNITDTAFDWNWERSIDGGEFKTMWTINYTRHK